MIESMAAGTPVIALRRGSVPEVIEDGVTGFICEDVDEMVDAVGRIDQIDPEACRRGADGSPPSECAAGTSRCTARCSAAASPRPGMRAEASAAAEHRGELRQVATTAVGVPG